ncbi:MAG: hypothetical protein JXK16_04740 [Thiotrichales bacterium]|nr:hypothetical protein [Thiotrichales bacterium]
MTDSTDSIDFNRALLYGMGEAERDAWLHCMQVALDKNDYPEALKRDLCSSCIGVLNHKTHFRSVSNTLINDRNRLIR